MMMKAIFNGMAIVGIVLAGSVNPANAAVLFSAEDDFSYPNGNLAGRGSAADEGWAGAWVEQNSTNRFQVTDGVVSSTAGERVHRMLSQTVEWNDDFRIVTISVDLDWGDNPQDYGALAAYNGDSSVSANRVMDLRNGDTLRFFRDDDIVDLTFTAASGINSYAIVIEYGSSASENASVELFENSISLGTTAISGEKFKFDRIAFAAFLNGNIAAADNLSITQVPEPGTLGLLGAGMGWLLLRRRRSY